MESPEEHMGPETRMRYLDASNRRIMADNAIDYCYRDLGVSEVPLVLLQHFRGNLDNWDPALIDALAADRRVVAFDNVGVAGTSGTTPNTVEAMAHGAVAFIEAMSLERVDLLGFSIGSFVAQEIALIRPDSLDGRHRREHRGQAKEMRRRSSVVPQPAGKPRGDLLEEPAVAVRIVEGGIREVGAMFRVRARKQLAPVAVEDLADLDAAPDEILTRRVDVRDD